MNNPPTTNLLDMTRLDPWASPLHLQVLDDESPCVLLGCRVVVSESAYGAVLVRHNDETLTVRPSPYRYDNLADRLRGALAALHREPQPAPVVVEPEYSLLARRVWERIRERSDEYWDSFPDACGDFEALERVVKESVDAARALGDDDEAGA